MAEAERAGAKAGNRAAGLERLGGGFGAVKDFQPVAERIVEHDQILDVPLVGQRAGAVRDFDPAVVQMRGERIERRRIGDLPAEKADAFAAVGVDNDALLAVVHAEGERRARFVDALQAEKARAVARPIAQILGANADITQSLRGGNYEGPHDGPRCHHFKADGLHRDGANGRATETQKSENDDFHAMRPRSIRPRVRSASIAPSCSKPFPGCARSIAARGFAQYLAQARQRSAHWLISSAAGLEHGYTPLRSAAAT